MLKTIPRGTNALVIGASGFLGTGLRRALVREGMRVSCFARTKPSDASLEGIAQWTIGEMADERTLLQAIAGNDLVFHLAHTTMPGQSNTDPVKEVSENVNGSLLILKACVQQGVRKIVFASSGGTVYGIPNIVPIAEFAPTNPLAAYGISKVCVEKYLYLFRHLYGLDYHVLRIANPYGPYQSPLKPQGLIANVIHRGLNGMPIDVFGDGSIIRDYVFVDDVVQALIIGARYDGTEKVMNVGSGEGRSIADVLNWVESALGMGSLSVNRRDERKVDVPTNILDIELIQRETGWRPLIGFGEGLARTIAWMRSTHSL